MDQNDRVRYEAELEEVLNYLDHPPAPDSPEGRRFAELLQHVERLAVLSTEPDEPPEPTAQENEVRAKLEALRRRAEPHRRPHFVEGGDGGLGPTLGMQLKGA